MSYVKLICGKNYLDSKMQNLKNCKLVYGWLRIVKSMIIY